MLVLAIDTATPAVTAGLLRLPGDGPPELLARRVTVDNRAHAELLTPSIRAVLAEAGVAAADLDAVVCGAGPGPFTGLRVGMVTAAAFADGLGIPVHPVCSLDAIAHEAVGPVLVATDARRREVYWARYDAAGARVDGPHVARPAGVPAGGAVRAAGAAAAMLGLPVVAPEYPGPVGLVAVVAAELRRGAPPAALTPLYLRRPDAVEPGARKRVTPA
ncbi:MAG: tRNA (adenosine(37)-N6)-threonylcarbamoyltransferase complex dimerization subunit type 1 TsaB [Pseudonocardiaceae bacterium]|nr:tRNA (adenosine(37)-N6)-threonylcarbamoyltransferase complex dimerization subunit type 1 TsaB [Pseudonocardiaceae bacterium]